MAEIITRNGFVVLVDDCDLPTIERHRWHAMAPDKRYPNARYAMTHVYCADAKRNRTLWMHRLLLAAPKGLQVDHIDRNGLNNRRSNLRLCSQSENNANSRYTNPTGYRGVHKTVHDTYRAIITAGVGHRPKMRQLGTYVRIEDAARAYDAAAIELFGEFATLNFPERRRA